MAEVALAIGVVIACGLGFAVLVTICAVMYGAIVGHK
jgi:hypothetical protein